MNDSKLVLAEWIRDIPDFPKPGIAFKDITPLLGNPTALAEAVRRMGDPFRGEPIDHVVAVEARGFLFGTPLALDLGVGIVPVRKPGKLPAEVRRFEYELEYGTDALEIHTSNTEEMCAELKTRYPGRHIVVCPDPSGNSRKTSSRRENGCVSMSDVVP